MTALPLDGPLKGECEGRAEVCSLPAQSLDCASLPGKCPLYGRLLKPSRDGKRRVQGCGDPVARGKRNRAKGDTKARRSRPLLGLEGANTRHEEHWRGRVLTEDKAGAKGGANKVFTAYRNARAQAEASRAIGDHRPFVAVFHPDGSSEFLMVVSSRDWDQVLEAYRDA